MSECVEKCELETNELVKQTVIEKGFSNDPLENPFQIKCECGNELVMETFLTTCQECNTDYAITPCHQDEPSFLAVIKK